MTLKKMHLQEHVTRRSEDLSIDKMYNKEYTTNTLIVISLAPLTKMKHLRNKPVLVDSTDLYVFCEG